MHTRVSSFRIYRYFGQNVLLTPKYVDRYQNYFMTGETNDYVTRRGKYIRVFTMPVHLASPYRGPVLSYMTAEDVLISPKTKYLNPETKIYDININMS